MVFERIVAADRWVLDSAYGAWLDVVLPRADLVVGLDGPPVLPVRSPRELDAWTAQLQSTA